MENNIYMTEKEYISQWAINAKKHFKDRDYERICELIQMIPAQHPIKRVFEIGCGAGYSTLQFLLNGFEIVSLDSNINAINFTKSLLENHKYGVKVLEYYNIDKSGNEVCLWKADLLEDFGRVKTFILCQQNIPIDLIVLCNPGGKLSSELTKKEYTFLKWGKFSDEEIKYGDIGLLHKWAMIFGACRLAKFTKCPVLIIDRGTEEEVKDILEQISLDTGLIKINQALRKIKNSASEGVKLSMDDVECFWGIGLYYYDEQNL